MIRLVKRNPGNLRRGLDIAPRRSGEVKSSNIIIVNGKDISRRPSSKRQIVRAPIQHGRGGAKNF
jgi:hypothetical protein